MSSGTSAAKVCKMKIVNKFAFQNSRLLLVVVVVSCLVSLTVAQAPDQEGAHGVVLAAPNRRRLLALLGKSNDDADFIQNLNLRKLLQKDDPGCGFRKVRC